MTTKNIEHKEIEISLDEWIIQYKPIPLPENLTDHSVGLLDDKTYGLETFGDNIEYIKQLLKEGKGDYIWTFQDDGDSTWTSNGYHLVNRLYYFVTEKPAPENTFVTVDLYNFNED